MTKTQPHIYQSRKAAIAAARKSLGQPKGMDLVHFKIHEHIDPDGVDPAGYTWVALDNTPAEWPAAKNAPTPGDTAATAAKPASKQETVLGLLKRPVGVTVAEIQSATGWQPHTVRAFISTRPKALGLTIEKEKREQGLTYRALEPA